MFVIRNYKPEDYSKVAGILKEAKLFDSVWDSEENLKGMISKDPESVLVAVENGLVVGNIFIMYYGPNLQYLFRLAVKKEFRNIGIATKLIDAAIKIALKKKAKETGLYVDSDNKILQKFYKKRGFKISRQKYFYMWKEN